MPELLRKLIEAILAAISKRPSPTVPPFPTPPVVSPPLAVPPAAPSTLPATTQRDTFLRCAQEKVGSRYVWATAGPDTFDCSGLVAFCYKQATGLDITRSSDEQIELGVAATGDGEPGDLLFWDNEHNGTAGHVGILEEGQTVINALNEARGVVRSDVTARFGGPFLGARRLPFDQAPSRPVITSQTRWRDAGAVDRDRVKEILAAYPLGAEAEAIYDAVQGRALPIAQAWMESRYGQDKHAQETHNPLGLMQSDGATLMTFSTWANAFREWVRRMDDARYKSGIYARNASLEEFITIYVGGPLCWATRGAECANGESWESTRHYLDETVARLNRYFQTETAPSPAKPNRNPFRKPRLYDVRNAADAATFGLTAEEVRALLSFSFGPRDVSDLWAVLHTQSGNTPGSLDWWIHGSTPDGQKVQASANYMAQRDGSLLLVIPENEGPWTNGDVKNPTAESAALRAASGNPNTHSLTCEAEGDWNEPFTPEQLQTILWLFAEWMLAYGFGLDHVLPHSSLNSIDRAHCPGGEHMQALRSGLREAGFR